MNADLNTVESVEVEIVEVVEVDEVDEVDEASRVPKELFKPEYRVDLTKYSKEYYNVKPNTVKSVGSSTTKTTNLERGHVVAMSPLKGTQKTMTVPEFLRVADKATPKGDFEGCLKEILVLRVRASVALETLKGLCSGMDEDTFLESGMPIIARFYGLSLRRSGTGKLMITTPEKGTEKFRAYDAARKALQRLKKELFSADDSADKKEGSSEIKTPEPTEEIDPIRLQEVAEAFLKILKKYDVDKKLGQKALSLALKARG